MAIRIRGNQLNTLVRQHGGTITYLDDGSTEGVEIFHCKWERINTLMPQRNKTKHPDFSSLTCATSSAVKLPGGVAKISVTYRGFLAGGEPSQNDWVQELMASTRQEPIETHPKFTSDIAGTPASPKNEAIFDDQGKFIGFKATSKYAGVKGYLVAGTTYRLRRTSGGRPASISDVGTISSPAVGVGIRGSMNWILVARTWRRSGGVYEINEEWQLSGPKGWDRTIYGG